MDCASKPAQRNSVHKSNFPLAPLLPGSHFAYTQHIFQCISNERLNGAFCQPLRLKWDKHHNQPSIRTQLWIIYWRTCDHTNENINFHREMLRPKFSHIDASFDWRLANVSRTLVWGRWRWLICIVSNTELCCPFSGNTWYNKSQLNESRALFGFVRVVVVCTV